MSFTTRVYQKLPTLTTMAQVSGVSVCAYTGYTGLVSAEGTSTSEKPPSANVSDVKTGSPWSLAFTRLTLKESTQINHNVKHLRFELPEGYTDASIGPITSMLSLHKPEDAWLPVLRPYTPIDTTEPGHLSFLVKLYPNGKGSGHLHSMSPGETLLVKPIHEFDYKPNAHSHITLVAGGAEITPFVQIIRRIVNDPEDKTSISLVYANKTVDDILLRSEFDGLQEKGDKFRVTYVVSDGKDQAGIVSGRVNSNIMEAAMPERSRWAQTKVLVCGPDGFADAVAGSKSGILKKLGIEKGQIKKF